MKITDEQRERLARGGADGRDRPQHGRLRRQHPRVPGLFLLEASGLIALHIGVILVARSPALPPRHRSRPPGLSCVQRGRWQPLDRGVPGGEEESDMGVAKKAKREAKAAMGKPKKGAGKVKHKGKKVKNAAEH
jgi:hypothetical protein